MSSDLEYIPTTDLIDELQKRMDCIVIVGSANRTEKEDSLLFVGKGSFHGCLGLCEAAKLFVLSRDEGVGEDDHT
jgi:hypothetical protein